MNSNLLKNALALNTFTMGGSSRSQLLSCVLFLTMLLTTPAISAAGLSMRAELTHVDSGRGFTKWELASRMAARSRARARSLHHRGGGGGGGSGGSHPATVPVVPGLLGEIETEYLIHFAIGTPQQHVALELDTGSDLVWTQCDACTVCFDQPFPGFDLLATKTLRSVPCADPICAGSTVVACYLGTHNCFYLDAYGDNSITAGKIFRDTLTFKAPDGRGGAVAVPNFAFGCGYFNKGGFRNNESGIAGFGRGSQSMPSQLKIGKFSYCFTSMHEKHAKSSPVFLGTPDDLGAHAIGPIQSTQMPRYRNSYYYLLFKGITVGKTRLPIDESVFAYKGYGKGGTIIDSGTGTTVFPQAVYDQLTTAFASQMHLHVINASDVEGRLCFSVPKEADDEKKVPKLVFHLAGADMDLPRESYVLTDGGIMCLMIVGAEVDQTIIGNYQQQNMHIVYDLANNKLLFAPAQCDKL